MGIVGLVLATMLVQASLAYPSGQPVTDYEISLHELNKVKKELPVKKKPKERGKRKKTEAVQQKAVAVATTPQGVTSQTNPPTSKSNTVPVPEPPQPKLQKPSEQPLENKAPTVAAPSVQSPAVEAPVTLEALAALAEYPRISHDPYSYLVAGKQTVLLAVISSLTDIKTVFCKFHSEDKGEDAIVPMTKVDGTQYTYRAILPGLASNARYLRYRLFVVDALGRETQSHEFSTNVKASPVTPGWQLENAPETLTVTPANSDKHLEK